MGLRDKRRASKQPLSLVDLEEERRWERELHDQINPSSFPPPLPDVSGPSRTHRCRRPQPLSARHLSRRRSRAAGPRGPTARRPLPCAAAPRLCPPRRCTPPPLAAVPAASPSPAAALPHRRRPPRAAPPCFPAVLRASRRRPPSSRPPLASSSYPSGADPARSAAAS
nr:classical arabinogalactan protein 4-like [Aegilops tauschii subsp. strangulata]